jgi:SRSO17 transposase
VVYRPLHEIALEQIRHAKANGVPLEWICADERYGMVPAFLEGVEKEGLSYVVEVPKGVTGWTACPEVWRDREHAPPEGQSLRTFPRVATHAPSPKSIEEIACHGRAIRKQPWVAFHLKETLKGPEVWEVKSCSFFHHRDGRASQRLRLVVARHVLDGTTKYFLAHAPADTPIETLLRVAFTRWRVERCFEDEKGRIGMDHFEVRRYGSIKRHLMLSMVSHLFLAEQHERMRGEKPLPHDLPSPVRDQCVV